MNISTDIEANKLHFDAVFCSKRNFDLKKRELAFAGKKAVMYMIDGFLRSDVLERILAEFSFLKKGDADDEEEFFEHHIPFAGVDKMSDDKDIVTAVLSGRVALMVDGFANAYIFELRNYPQRDNAEPDRDKVLRGSRDGFTETMLFNAALIRRRIRDNDLSIEYQSIGTVSRTDIALCYLNSKVDRKMLDDVRSKIKNSKIEALTMSQEDMANVINGKQRWNPFPKYKFSERPDVAAAQIMQGDLIVLVDNTPTAMIMPATVFDIAEDANDYYFPPLTGAYLRITRILIMLATLFVTPVWMLALEYPEYVPEVFKFVLVEEKQNIPIIWQLLILEFVIDGLKLSSLNTPGMLSSTFSIIAGIIVSDFAVKSGWFDAETMLYMAFVAMANYSQPGYELGYAIKFMRMFMLVATAIFGIWGFAAGIALTLYLVLSTKIHGKKGYFFPVIPFSAKGIAQLLFRLK
ncbi:MAG: spore germination protein [Oscillospiraceae bacterium]|nr:spore germination protein [Oscillospiraceae bacterium]MBQ2794806.1 spore germination protein [Oscillospiraceae bacterium]MBQ3561476.1 spore germination protein [Oscillospiraceae bacterium]